MQKVSQVSNLNDLEALRVEVLGKKGFLAAQFAKMKEVEDKKAFAATLNEQKAAFESALSEKKSLLQREFWQEKMRSEGVDVTAFNEPLCNGGLHPVMETMDEIISYFTAQNYAVETGPLIEDDFHNFEALNLPPFHPARDMQDTFYLSDGRLLRTHTSPTQVRTMLSQKPPIRMIAPGSVFRRDMDLTHTPMFHQVEGLVVDEVGKVSFASLKFALTEFLRYFFGDVKVRFRPSFFPFTEPSAEVDIGCIFCGSDGCRVCKHTGWLEVLGCGVVDPNVFKAVGYEGVSGYAFGLGVERFAMLSRGVPDLRSLFEGDIRLLEQFR